MTNTLVTIVLPTFNGSKFIREAIESCLRQSYTNIELIIVNDCSTDNTLDIVEEYARNDKRITLISNENNKKLPASLNIGFRNSTGQFLTWISDDNIFNPLAIETMVRALKEREEIDIVYSSYYFIDETGNKLNTFGSLPEELIFKCAPGACFLYKRVVHEKLNGFDETKFRMEDFDFWLRAATKFKYAYINNTDLYYYRKHNNNLTSAIYSNKEIYNEYRKHHFTSFKYFFNAGLMFDISDEELELHLELYFEDIIHNKNWDFSISDKVVRYVSYLDILKKLDWAKLGFEQQEVEKLIVAKKERMIQIVINDLVFETKLLQKKNPQIATQLNKPISWYYQEYETLPDWFKKLGHIIKAFQGNKSWKSLINN